MLLLLSTCLVPLPVAAELPLGDSGKLSLEGDFRLRLEADWDSKRPDGGARDDRTRVRVRGRLALRFVATDKVTLGLRLRSGARESQQSPHLTLYDFEDNPRGDAEAMLDKWFLRAEGEKGWLLLGRDSYPFWKQNEMFWDDDVTTTGLVLGHRREHLRLTVAWLALPDGGVDFGGTLAGGQVLVSPRLSGFDLDLAATVLRLEGDGDTRYLRQGNGARDYTLWQASVRVGRPWRGKPLSLGLDLTHNSESYRADDPDPVTAANHDQVDGWVASLLWGQAKDRGQWQVGYYFAHLETLAVNASYAQDDWVRWGSATQTDSSDLEGHELRVVYGLGKKSSLMARLYLVEALTSVQDGRRLRIDYNVRF